MDITNLKGLKMTRESIQEKIDQAKSQLDEIRSSRTRAQEAIRQFDLNEAGWLGYLEAMTTLLKELPEEE